ncbi:MAG TPA: hypothetical protein VJ888_09330 [Mobilitalea sp.]|nr:hypothetical protein [Mobilitalea sp.]
MVDQTYINILTDTLNKKTNILDQLIRFTVIQEDIVTGEAPDMNRLDQTISEKEVLIAQLEQLDEGFEKVYLHVKEDVTKNKEGYKDQIIILQDLIRLVTKKSTALQAAEFRNKNKFANFFVGKKKEIKNFKMSSQTANSYYRSATEHQQGQAHFLDKKK